MHELEKTKNTVHTTETASKEASQGDRDENSVPATKKSFSILKALFKWVLILALILGLLLTWIIGTTSGTRTAFSTLQKLLPIPLEFKGVQGRLYDEMSIDEVRFSGTNTIVTLDHIQIKWQSSSLFSKLTHIYQLHGKQLKIAYRPTSAPATIPNSFASPINFQVDDLALDRLSIVRLEATNGSSKAIEKEVFYLHSLQGNFSSVNQQAASHLQGQMEWGKADVQAHMQQTKPFTLKADFEYQSLFEATWFENLDEHLRTRMIATPLVGKIDGTLDLMHIQAKDKAALEMPHASPNIAFESRIETFTSQPIRLLKLDTKSFFPQAYLPFLPHAELDMHIDLQPVLNESRAIVDKNKNIGSIHQNNQAHHFHLQGPVQITNHIPQSFNENAYPASKVQFQFDWKEHAIAFENLLIQMTKGGRIQGDMRANFDKDSHPDIQAKLEVENLNIQDFYSHTFPTHLNGQVNAQMSNYHAVNWKLNVKDNKLQLVSKGEYVFRGKARKEKLNLDEFNLTADRMQFSGKGELNLEQTQNFYFDGDVKHFDPSLWGRLPAADVNGGITMQGQIKPQLEINIQAPQIQGDIQDKKFQSQIDINLKNQILDVKQFNFSIAKNMMVASGSLGRSDKSLNVKAEIGDIKEIANIFHLPITGTFNGDFDLTGKLSDIGIKGRAKIQSLSSPWGNLEQADLSAHVEPHENGRFELAFNAEKFSALRPNSKNTVNSMLDNATDKKEENYWVHQLHFETHGSRSSHQFHLFAQLPQQHKIQLGGRASFKWGNDLQPMWQGLFETALLQGVSKINANKNVDANLKITPEDYKLEQASAFYFSPSLIKISNFKLLGNLGRISLNEFNWMPQSLVTQGVAEQFPAMDLMRYAKLPIQLKGNLRLGLNWDVSLGDQFKANIHLQKQSGDIAMEDVSGNGKLIPMGLRTLEFNLSSTGKIPKEDAEGVQWNVKIDGDRLGQWQAHVNTQLKRSNGAWVFDENTPIKAEGNAALPELQWLVNQFQDDLVAKGKLTADASFHGSLKAPHYIVNVESKELELAMANEGLYFPNGSLKAFLSEDIFRIDHLKFANKVNLIPKKSHLEKMNLEGKVGSFFASGEVNLKNQTGGIKGIWQQFPVLQRKDRWLLMSGELNITQENTVWSLIGKLNADAAYFQLPKMPPPSLSNDVFVSKPSLQSQKEGGQHRDEYTFGNQKLQTKLDLIIDMGPQFIFVGRGLDTALSGNLRLRGQNNSPIQATGSIATRGGIYEGYGQKLEIERGVLSFQGAPNNPLLNVRALRKGLAVEAGVDIIGSVANPKVQLVSEPNVPDTEKLAWLVSGREFDKEGAVDVGLLLTAANIILGGDEGRNVTKNLMKDIGIDSFNIGPSEIGSISKLPNHTVAGATGVNNNYKDNAAQITKNITPEIVASLERSLTDASTALKLSWQLSQRIRVVGKAGTDNAIDLKYRFSFQ